MATIAPLLAWLGWAMGTLDATVVGRRGEVGLAERVAGIEPFQVVRIFERARELEAEGRHVVHFEVGESDFPSAPPIIKAGASSLEAGHTGYTEGLGLPALREALAARYGELGIGADRVAVTTGASGALNVLAQVLVDPGAEVLGTDPGYPCNRVFVEAAGGTLRALNVDASTRFQPTAAMIAEAWRPNTAGVLLGSPSNPSGSILAPEELAAICDVVRGRGFVIVDEIYQGLVYDDDAPRESALAVDDGLFVVNSFSKYFGMTGWRLGWLVAPAWAMDGIDRTAQNLYLAPPTVSQHAGIAALGPAAEVVHEQRREIFRQRRDQLLDGLDALALPAAHRPQGAFYVYVGIAPTGMSSGEFCRRLLEEHGVAVTPGTDFGRYRADDHVRFSFTVDESQIGLGLERLEAALKHWR